jgi:hypothetical protein
MTWHKIFFYVALCSLFFFSFQSAHGQKLKGKTLVKWINSKTWVLYDYTDKQGRTGVYEWAESEEITLDGGIRWYDGCNTCYRKLKFDTTLGRIHASNENICTEKKCLDDLPDLPSLVFNDILDKPLPIVNEPKNEFVLLTPRFDGMKYQQEGEYLVLSDETGKYRFKAQEKTDN